MQATVGDRLLLHSKVIGGKQVADVLEVRGDEGAPPYLVRFSDGHEGLIYPGPDCLVQQRKPSSGS